VPLPGGALFVAHLSGSLSHVFGMGNLLEFGGSWRQGGDAVCHHMKTVDPTKQRSTVMSFKYMNKDLTPKEDKFYGICGQMWVVWNLRILE